MKLLPYLLLLISALFLTGCEEVVHPDLDTAPPRLVVDASLDWIVGTDGSRQTIRLTTTTAYYATEIPAVTGATVFVTDGAGTIFTFAENTGTGNYVCTDFVPLINQTYVLTIVYEGQTYMAAETLHAVPEITHVVQNNDGGFLGDAVEVRFFYNDNGDEENYYLDRFDAPVIPFPDYDVNDDEFSNGNEMFGIFSDDDLKPNDIVTIKLFGISQGYYNYMNKLLEVSDGGGGGPFSTPPATVRGNVVNQTDVTNYALGYFRVTQADTLQYTVQ